MIETQKHYTLRATAELLGVQVRTVREWVRKGTLKAFKYPNSRMWIVPQSEIDRLTTKEKEEV